MRGNQCPKALWLLKKKKYVLSPPDSSQEALFQQGHQVGELAQKLYPGGQRMYQEGQPFATRFTLTSQSLQAGLKTLYEASFKINNLMCMVDILHFGPKGWELIEVKSSTKAKDEHVEDLAFQYAIVHLAGVKLSCVKLVYLNNSYIRKNTLDINKLFCTQNLTDEILNRQSKIKETIKALMKVCSQYKEPEQALGEHCIKPYTCDAKAYCWKGLEKETVFQLNHLTWKERFELYNQGKVFFKDLLLDPATYSCETNTDDVSSKHALSQIMIKAHSHQQTHFEKKSLQNFLDNLAYPIAFLDFETFQYPVPLFKNCKTYQQIPFQFSMHLLNSPFDQLSHKEFIAEPEEDPRLSFCKALIQAVPKHASVMVYNAQFEASIISLLQEWFPFYYDSLQCIKNRLVDLMLPFKEKQWYDPAFNGRYSIKVVYPTLINNKAYETLNISNGLEASQFYLSCVLASQNNAPHTFVTQKDDLLAYCKQDTLAMVELLTVIKKQCLC